MAETVGVLKVIYSPAARKLKLDILLFFVVYSMHLTILTGKIKKG